MLEQYAIIKALGKIIALPRKSFSVRELAIHAGISPGASKNALDYMRKKGIITLNVIGRTYQYKLDLESPLCRHWKILFNLDLLEESGIVGNLAKNLENIHCILLYGSFAEGTNDEKSDVDLLVIAHTPKKIDLGFARKLGKEANITIMSMADWRKKAAEDKVFYENVIYDSIVLYGKRPVVL